MNANVCQKFLSSTAAIAVLAFATPLFAQTPQDPVVTSGAISVSRSNSGLVVTQSTDRGVIDWRSFSVGARDSVRFDQPGRSSVTLNRVTGMDISRLDGRLSATGQVWLANPNGVLIGPSGQIDVGGLVATTGRIDAQEFLRSGKLNIDQVPRSGMVRNEGVINIADGGYAALAAAAIKNRGVISARTGTIAMGAGKAMTLDFHGDKLIQFQVSQPLDQPPIDADTLIQADGRLKAPEGSVILTARAAKNVIDSVINLKGHVAATQVRIDGGSVILGEGGKIEVSGGVDVSNPKGRGGSVIVLGEKVGLMDGASIDASGASAGGTVLIGGGWQGKDASGAADKNAQIAYMAPTATISVDATEKGDGGIAVVWADDSTRFAGTIKARGGALGGEGGHVETSGKRALDVAPDARVDVGSRLSGEKNGEWLLDPANVTIAIGGAGAVTSGVFNPLSSSTIAPSTIAAGLSAGDVTIQTTAGSGGPGDINFSSGTIAYSGSTARTLTLRADRDISFRSGTSVDLSGSASRFQAQAGRNISIGPSGAVNSSGGSIVLNSDRDGIGGGAIRMDVGSSLSSRGGDIILGGGSDPRTGYATGATGLASGVLASGIILSSATIDTGDGEVSIRGLGRSGDAAGGVRGVSILSSNITARGGLSVEGVGGDASANQGQGINIFDTSITTGSLGSISLRGRAQAAGDEHEGVQIHNSASRAIMFGSGGLSISGTASQVGAGIGVQIYDATTIIGTGAITINGTGGGTSGTVDADTGVNIKTSGVIKSTNGSINITGVRGGARSRNVTLGGTGVIATEGGDLNVIGTSSTGGALPFPNAIDAHGVRLIDGVTLMTATGQITVTGVGATAGTVSHGISIGDDGTSGTMSATGAGGSILLKGTAGTGGVGLNLAKANISAANGTVTLEADSLTLGTSEVTTTTGKTVIRPMSTTSSIGAFGGAGSLQLPSTALHNVSGDLEIGRSDLTGDIRIGADAKIKQNTAFRTGGGSVVFEGPIDGVSQGGQSLSVTAGGGAASFGGAVGQTTALAAVNVMAGTISFNGADQITTVGTQRYAGAVLLNGPTTFSTVNQGILFTDAVNAGANGGILIARTGTGTTSFANGAGSTTPLDSLSVMATRLGKTVWTVGSQSYGVVVVMEDAVLRTDNAPVNVAGSVDGPAALTVRHGAGTVSVSGAVGGTTQLASLNFEGSGSVVLSGVSYTPTSATIQTSPSVASLATLVSTPSVASIPPVVVTSTSPSMPTPTSATVTSTVSLSTAASRA